MHPYLKYLRTFVNEYSTLKERVYFVLRSNIFSMPDIVILDDTFPNLLSPFRIAEFNAYLKHFNNCLVFTTVGGYLSRKKEYVAEFPDITNKIFKFDLNINIHAKLTYVAFLHNIYKFLPFIEKNHLPFIFELYPGGGFCLNNADSDRKLMRIFASKYFRRVIVTQGITKDYLLKKNLCPRSKVSYIYGGPLRLDDLIKKVCPKKYYPIDKNTFDICFVAHKNIPMGKDKGYDLFIEVARSLIPKYKNIMFHVVGNFDESDIDVKALSGRIKFYGLQKIDFFQDFYSSMDIILSPNRPNTLAPGAFDAFLTGNCIEAGRCEVALMVTDELSINDHYSNNEELVIIRPNSRYICSKIIKYYGNPSSLYKIANKARVKLNKQYSNEIQLCPRYDLLEKIIKG